MKGRMSACVSLAWVSPLLSSLLLVSAADLPAGWLTRAAECALTTLKHGAQGDIH